MSNKMFTPVRGTEAKIAGKVMGFNDGYVYWVDDYIENVKDLSEEYIYFRGRSLKWKMINKK